MSARRPLPPGLLASLAATGGQRVVLIRHSDRYPIADGDDGAHTALTPEGVLRAEELGAALGAPLEWALSSPLRRCVMTAELMGAAPEATQVLGAPGPFVLDSARGGEVFTEFGTRAVVYGQLHGEVWGCMRPLEEGARMIWELLAAERARRPGQGVAVTHDAILMPFVRWATGYEFEGGWLEPLDGVVISEDAVFWQGQRFEVTK